MEWGNNLGLQEINVTQNDSAYTHDTAVIDEITTGA